MSRLRRLVLSAVCVSAGFAAVCGRTAEGQTTVTVDVSTQRLTGGVGSLDRAKYFNYHGTLVPPVASLRQSIYAEDGLNAAPGRVSTELDQFIAQGLPEDPARPGYIDPDAARAKIQGDYRNFVLNGTRWEPLRNLSDKPVFVQSGRNGGFFPDYLDSGTPMPTNFDAYADFLNVYLEEAVYGSNAFLPIETDRFYLEVMNEPNWSSWTQWGNVIDMHRVVTEQVKERFPQTKIGGVSCCDDLTAGANSWDLAQQVIDDMVTWQTPSGQSAQLDFYTIHPYERYDVQGDGSVERAVDTSPGHTAGIMDLYEAYSFNTLGDPKQFAITEYGSFNWAIPGTSDYGNYARDEQQWDLVRDITEKMLVFMDRPDRIINATPFVSPRHWQNAIPTNPEGDNVFFEQDASGAWNETIVASLFRMFAPVNGSYVHTAEANPDLQTVAFRDGDELHVVLNNLDSTPQAVDLSSISGVTSASWSRVFRAGGANQFLQDVDASGSWQNLTLEGNASAVLTLRLDSAAVFDHAYDTRAHYGDRTEVVIVPQQLLDFGIEADTTDAVSAKLRLSFGLVNSAIPAIEVLVNGNAIAISDEQFDYDDDDLAFVSREIDVPLAYLTDGANAVSLNFLTAGTLGKVAATVLEVTRSVGDYDGSGALGAEDVDALYQRFGPAAANDEYDLNNDQVVDAGDVDLWLGLRNASRGDTNADGDIDTADAVAVLANLGLSGDRPNWTRGNFDADGLVGFADLSTVLESFEGADASGHSAAAIDGQADNPNLLYDASSGRLQVSADGLTVLAFSIATEDGFTGPATFAELDAHVGNGEGLSDSTPNQIGWISVSALQGQGADGPDLFDLGVAAPVGLTPTELDAYLSSAIWSGFAEGGFFDLLVIPELTGDFNADGVVDAADYTVYRDTHGSTSDLRADANADGVVNQADFDLWMANFGTSAAAANGVPEPSGWCLMTAFVVHSALRRAARATPTRRNFAIAG